MLEFHGANPQEWYKATFTLREDTTPKQLEAVVTECPVARYVGKTAHAIYKIETASLRLPEMSRAIRQCRRASMRKDLVR